MCSSRKYPWLFCLDPPPLWNFQQTVNVNRKLSPKKRKEFQYLSNQKFNLLVTQSDDVFVFKRFCLCWTREESFMFISKLSMQPRLFQETTSRGLGRRFGRPFWSGLVWFVLATSSTGSRGAKFDLHSIYCICLRYCVIIRSVCSRLFLIFCPSRKSVAFQGHASIKWNLSHSLLI